MKTGKKYYTITQLTKEFGISTRTLRFYEDQGLLHPERRGRTRLYSLEDRHQLVKILQARRIGFSVAEIAELLEFSRSLPDTTQQLKTIVEQITSKRQQLRRQRRDLEMVMKELNNLEDDCLAKLAEIGVNT